MRIENFRRRIVCPGNTIFHFQFSIFNFPFSILHSPYIDVLSALAQWGPGAEVPTAFHREWRQGWQRRLADEDEDIRQAAALALLRRALESEIPERWRREALEVWSAGTKGATAERQILETAVSRLQEVRARLAAGKGADFEEKPVPSAQRPRPPLTDTTWEMENGEWEMKNGKWKMKNEGTKPANHPTPEGPAR